MVRILGHLPRVHSRMQEKGGVQWKFNIAKSQQNCRVIKEARAESIVFGKQHTLCDNGGKGWLENLE